MRVVRKLITGIYNWGEAQFMTNVPSVPKRVVSCFLDDKLVDRLDRLCSQVGWFRSALMAKMLEKEIELSELEVLKQEALAKLPPYTEVTLKLPNVPNLPTE